MTTRSNVKEIAESFEKDVSRKVQAARKERDYRRNQSLTARRTSLTIEEEAHEVIDWEVAPLLPQTPTKNKGKGKGKKGKRKSPKHSPPHRSETPPSPSVVLSDVTPPPFGKNTFPATQNPTEKIP